MERNLEELFGLVQTKPIRASAEDTWTHYRGIRHHTMSAVIPPRRTVTIPAGPVPALVAGFIGVVLYGALRGK